MSFTEQTESTPYKEIRARQPSPDTLVVYQAYSASIARSATEQQKLSASSSFKVGRMTWIKPSFFWCMYRAGWSYKDRNQERILAITMKREGLVELLAQATKTPDSPVRFQWDPERNVRLHKLSYRSLQLGISSETLVTKWIDEWIVKIEDITDDVRRWKSCIDEGEEGIQKVVEHMERPEWLEKILEVPPEIRVQLQMDLPSKTTTSIVNPS
ncbi:hypothetical protein B0H14DRAFT_3003726 [Mycena olivaceomarginata]|nr:hypothetical protein B0H14DRAFT_3003726 [Mycena olivaceomarginata]